MPNATSSAAPRQALQNTAANADLVGADAFELALKQQIRIVLADLLACNTRGGRLRYARILLDHLSQSQAESVSALRDSGDR